LIAPLHQWIFNVTDPPGSQPGREWGILVATSGELSGRQWGFSTVRRHVKKIGYQDPPRSLDHQGKLRDLTTQLGDRTREALYVVPMLIAQRLQSAGDFRAALDWYWLVYPYDVANPISCYDPINHEELRRPDLTFPPQWTTMLDPFTLVAHRP